MPQQPGRVNPLLNPEAAVKRRNYVIGLGSYVRLQHFDAGLELLQTAFSVHRQQMYSQSRRSADLGECFQ